MSGADCTQENRLSHLENDVAAAIREFRDGQREQTELLRDIARQGVRIDGLEHTDQRLEKALNELFRRVRDLELLPGRRAGKAWFLTAMAGSGTASGVISGVVVFFITKGG